MGEGEIYFRGCVFGFLLVGCLKLDMKGGVLFRYQPNCISGEVKLSRHDGSWILSVRPGAWDCKVTFWPPFMTGQSSSHVMGTR